MLSRADMKGIGKTAETKIEGLSQKAEAFPGEQADMTVPGGSIPPGQTFVCLNTAV